MKQYTSSEQTAKLIELGFEKPKNIVEGELYSDIYFAYSIGELIEMLKPIKNLRISVDNAYNGLDTLIVKRLVGDKWDILYGKVGKELADLLVDAIVKLKEEGVI